MGPGSARPWLPIVLGLLVPGSAQVGLDVTVSQTDWSGQPGGPSPVSSWGSGFDSADGVSWRALPGQLALASIPLAVPSRRVVDGASSGALKVVAGDLDDDGDADVLVAAYWDNTIVAWFNDGGGSAWHRQVIATGFTHAVGLSTADVNGDGKLDIVGGAGESGVVSWWRNDGGDPIGWVRQDVDSEFHGAHDVAAADLDGDGDNDLVGAAWEDDQVAWWRNDGGDPILWVKAVIGSAFDYACKVDLADVDGDGDVDVVATAWTAQEIRWWRNDGGDPLAWSEQTIAQGFTGTHWVECADVDGDGRTDVLAAAMDRSEVAWWRNDGSEPIYWLKHTLSGQLSGAVSVASGDLDGDGDTDAAGAGWSTTGGIAWWENRDGAGTTWTRRSTDGPFRDASSVHLADVDGDGALDILASSWTLNQVAWWRVSQFRSQGVLTSSILDCGTPVAWVSWSADIEQKEGTNVVLAARVGDDPQAMEPWVELEPGQPLPFSGMPRRYLQYRLTLITEDPVVSPIVREVSFSGEAVPGHGPRSPRRRLSHAPT